MGRKRKTVVGSNTIANQVKNSNACPMTTSTDEKIHPHSNNSNDLPAMKKESSDTKVFVRRSRRLKSAVLSSGSRGVKPLVENIDLVEIENEEAEVTTLPESNNEINLEENDDFVSVAVEELKSEVARKTHEGCSPNFSYKSLYVASQKKIEALMEANYAMVKKLEFARGKVEAYEKMSFALAASKEATVSLSPQTVQKCIDPPPDAMRDATDDPNRKKKNYKKRKTKAL